MKKYSLFLLLIVLFSPIYAEPLKINMVSVPEQKYKMLTTEVTQELYEAVMGENPSYFKGNNFPVENVSWYDAIYFCNKLSEMQGLEPVYSSNGRTKVTSWNYKPHTGEKIKGGVEADTSKNGFRLPTLYEWSYCAIGGQLEMGYLYSGSSDLEEIAWVSQNSDKKTHDVAGKKPNGYGLFDMNGNVFEWCYELGRNKVDVFAANSIFNMSGEKIYCGGSYKSKEEDCVIDYFDGGYFGIISKFYRREPVYFNKTIGFRIVSKD